jgi:hypothetical protein
VSIYAAPSRAKQAARAAYDLWRSDPARRRDDARPLCLVYGNCQAEPVRALLAGSPEFADSYEAVRLPAVHEIRASNLPRFGRLVRAASVIAAQPIKDGYRGLGLGTKEVLALAPSNCKVIRFQALHYDAHYPFQFNLRDEDLRDVAAPLTAYHDLRVLCAAAKGLSVEAAARWISEYRPPEAALRAAAEQAEALIRDRDRTTDISIAESIVAPPRTHGPSFLTVNHPTRLVLQRTASAIERMLGVDATIDAGGAPSAPEPLGRYRTPLEHAVVDALGLPWEPTTGWIVKGRRVSTADVARRHLRWYRRRPDYVKAGLGAHAERIAAFGLL